MSLFYASGGILIKLGCRRHSLAAEAGIDFADITARLEVAAVSNKVRNH
jgi:hypothetical protein